MSLLDEILRGILYDTASLHWIRGGRMTTDGDRILRNNLYTLRITIC